MPTLRSANGSKMLFTQARLSSLLSLVYVEAMGNQVSRYRSEIQQHCFRVWDELEQLYGRDEKDLWPGSGIRKAIEQRLRDFAPLEIQEAFLSLNIQEFEEQARPAPIQERNKPIHKPSVPALLPDADSIDPVWAIVLPHDALAKDNSSPKDASLSHDKPSFVGLADRMGVTPGARLLPTGGGTREEVHPGHIWARRRSEWLAFWRRLFVTKDIPWGVWEKQILALPPDHVHRSLDGWWGWWQDQLDAAMLKNPQLHELRRALHERSRRAAVTKQTWAEGTTLAPDNTLLLEHGPVGDTWYRRLGIEHLKTVWSNKAREQREHRDGPSSSLSWDWTAIGQAMAPGRDGLLSWAAWLHMDEAGALWPLQGRPWSNGAVAQEGCKEMPQWAWMRTAMAMAEHGFEAGQATANAIALYERLSTLKILPSAACVREAGKADPRYFDDQVWDVGDQFVAIQDVIYSTAVDTVWTGTTASNWERVRSKQTGVRSGTRKATGVNDFLRTIDAHLRAQGRQGDDRPVTVELPIWHLDIEEFLTLQHQDGPRLQPVVMVSDVFMARVAEQGTWTLFDPHVYPEVLRGPEGYREAEELLATRQKLHPSAHRVVGAERLWKKLLTHARQGSPFVTFSDGDRTFCPLPQGPVVHGLDGVGTFPAVSRITADDGSDNGQLQWLAMAINLQALISDQGEPLLDEWRESITWAFWMAEAMYVANEDMLSNATKTVRPLCLGAVGFHEAIGQAMAITGLDVEAISAWVARISEAWGTLICMVDQVFCQRYGPAPLWQNNNLHPQPFHPRRNLEQLRQARGGGMGIAALPPQMSELFDQITSHRFSTRTVWAPFRQAARWGGVSPGGFGTLFPLEWVADERKIVRLNPTNFLLHELYKSERPEEFGSIFAHPQHPAKWPEAVRRLCVPDMEQWKARLRYASLVKPWIDQGVSVTLPAGLPSNTLSILLQQSWWMGVSNVRFEDPFRRPDAVDQPRLEDEASA